MSPMPNYPMNGDLRLKDTAFPLIVGTRGWKHQAWLEHYYPPDLPPEWQLAFYANDFSGVLIPAEEWQAADDRQLGQWCDETPEHFAMLIEADDSGQADQTKIDALGDHFAGMVNMLDTPRKGLLQSAALHHLDRKTADVVLLTAGDLADKRRLGQHLLALATQRPPVRALIVTGAIEAAAVQDLRVLAELTGLA